MTTRSSAGPQPRQLVLDIARAPSFAADDYLVASCNATAFAAIDAWPSWPDRVMLLLGPAGAGKSHLGHIWAERAAAVTKDVAPERNVAMLIEDCDRQPFDEAKLFHLLNRVREGDGWVLITARTPPDAWGMATPDLLSRLRLAPSAVIGHPDEALLKEVLIKLFADRQLQTEERLVNFIARHCDRSLGAIRDFVSAIDERSLASGRRISRQLVSTVFNASGTTPPDAD